MHEWKHDKLELDADFSLFFFRRKNVSKLHLDLLLSYNIHWFENLTFPRSNSTSENESLARSWLWSAATSEILTYPALHHLCASVHLPQECMHWKQKAGGRDDEEPLWFEGEPRRRWMLLSLRRTQRPTVLLLIHPEVKVREELAKEWQRQQAC